MLKLKLLLTLSNNILNTFIFKAKRLNLLAFFVLLNTITLGQDCLVKELPFKGGEQINYDAFYNLKSIWVAAGKVRFTVSDTTYKGEKCFHFDGKGKSLKSYDWFFKVRDHYASIASKENLVPRRFVRKVNEGGFKIFYDYHFNKNETAKVYQSRTDTTNQKLIKVPKCSFDVMTAVYYARTLDFSGLGIGDTIPLSFMIDKQIYNVHIRYTGKQIVKTLDKKKYNCIKFRPMLIEGSLFEEGEFMEVFVTDDKNRIPIYIEAEIVVGKVKAYMTSMKNVKYPLTSRIKP